MNKDEILMKRAVSLAKKAEGMTSPNPMVGAVIVKNGVVVGEGWHRRAGEPHAEILAIESAGKRARGADMYVSLEPCVHFGRTGPCAPQVVEAGIKRVVVGSTDPNPKVRGRGMLALKSAGVAVVAGVLKQETDRLNEVFFHWIKTRRPFVIVKVAQSLDGKIATAAGDSKWITCEQSRRWVHGLRSKVDAVVVGVGTVLADDPMLTNRVKKNAKQPLAIILDADLKTPTTAKALDHPRGCFIFTRPDSDNKRALALEKAGATIIETPVRDGEIEWKPMLENLGKRDITSVLVEGGSTVFGSALRSGMANKLYIFAAPIIVGGDSSRGSFGGVGALKIKDAPRLKDVTVKKIGDDFLFEAYTAGKEK